MFYKYIIMESKFNEIKKTFNVIKDIREEINSIFANLEQRISKLKELYRDFINTNNSSLFVFGLDSFYFQNKLIDIEDYDMRKFYDLIMNRMYCEYYKLFKIICEYCKNNLKDDNKLIESLAKEDTYPNYKDLEPYKKYDFKFVDSLHEDITSTLININNYLTTKNHVLSSYKLRSDVGLNINNFVSTYEFEVCSIQSQMHLFCSYVNFFHELHLKYLKRFVTKIQILYAQINHDIKFDEVLLNQKSDKKKFMQDMKKEIDPKIMKELRASISISKNDEKLLSSDSDEEDIEDNNIKKIGQKIQTILDNSGNSVRNPITDIAFNDFPIENTITEIKEPEEEKITIDSEGNNASEVDIIEAKELFDGEEVKDILNGIAEIVENNESVQDNENNKDNKIVA
jgi:hypothetical protein